MQSVAILLSKGVLCVGCCYLAAPVPLQGSPRGQALSTLLPQILLLPEWCCFRSEFRTRGTRGAIACCRHDPPVAVLLQDRRSVLHGGERAQVQTLLKGLPGASLRLLRMCMLNMPPRVCRFSTNASHWCASDVCVESRKHGERDAAGGRAACQKVPMRLTWCQVCFAADGGVHGAVYDQDRVL